MIYKFFSSDPGAPTLSGTVGHLINVLDACLVHGYGSVAVSSMTRSGSVVTVTTSAPHGFVMYGTTYPVGPVAEISGANESAYNGKWEVASVTSTTVFTFNIGAATPASPATGTITSKRAPVGWTKAFSGTNKAAYRQPAGSNQFYLRVDDSSPTGGNAICVAARGYETMSDVDTGTNPFPTVAQVANGIAFSKSDAVSSATRNWALLSDGYAFWFIQEPSAGSHYGLYFFGDLVSYKPGDSYHTALIGGTVSTSISNTTNSSWSNGASNLSTTSNLNYLARPHTQIVGAIQTNWAGDNAAASGLGGGGMSNPSPVDNGIYVAKCRVNEATSSGVLRGEWPGIYQPLHPRGSIVTYDVLEQVVGLDDRALMAFYVRVSSTTNTHWGLFDLTGPWR